jgi:DNA-binding MarR family transcriptional regulator
MKAKGAKRPQTALDDGNTPHTDAVVALVRLGETFRSEVNALVEEWGVTYQLFNILRILYVRDPERKGLSRSFIEQRLLYRMPDVTRLVDRLEAAGFVRRHRPEHDQRTVLTTITDRGWDLIEDSHQPLLALNRRQLQGFSDEELQQFLVLLRKALNRPSA